MMNEKWIKVLVLTGLVLAVIFTPILLSAQTKMLQVKGSDTMVNLAQILAEEFMAQNPKMPIAVLGGGSGTGITGLINGTCDIANSSRDWKAKELNLAFEKGVKPRLFAVAVDGLSIIINEKNPLTKLTMEQVGAIYRGEVKNWKGVGGPDQKISLYGRQSNSGTYAFLMEHVMGNRPYSTDMKEMNGNAQIIEGVLADASAIGYVGVGYVVDKNTGKALKGLKILDISQAPNGTAYSPLDKTAVDSGQYPISRPLWMAVNGTPKDVAAAFLRYAVGPEGQKVVEREGFYTVGGRLQEQNQKNLK
ncbi:MAG TPA: PstS family phosphate ABC transporter substrate-binding protein [Candidatus Aminicenantes bacterium]|jgi:phosphate transport system substrate-binding protein|nr:MAG: Phosphate-binding protein PstS precursor [Candidatus Aminicenantes bacterium ADurb.Bin147]HNQ80486.1 PstS family phosphate ABC transporter substrate-binding protein [Candidatus Aminicenantes bacterium]HNT31933.1 PstS family phosphate ABC transporter substrate-binding protein [Candidatus Aminicenantes bacterium]HOU49433.1 PstS family phosphate ABC transporter substrate-binding protein [Candidatus Aminicenantes bacterium]HPH43530.1 PstS family phosphate ABC transporter substrate-binding p